MAVFETVWQLSNIMIPSISSLTFLQLTLAILWAKKTYVYILFHDIQNYICFIFVHKQLSSFALQLSWHEKQNNL